MRIGELSEKTGVSVRSLRYYEQKGLLTPFRQVNGYREYANTSIEQVQTIQFYLSLGLSTDEISSFLQCVLKNKESFCTEILPIYEEKLNEINEQLKLLSMIKENLIERIQSIKNEQKEGEHK